VADYRSRLASDCHQSMSDDNNGSFELSRRKALGALGGIGTATALGGIGTYAQFTDTEEQYSTFSAGGIDGQLRVTASYNGESLDGQEEDGYVVYDGEGPGASIVFEDLKPGDYGSFCFELEVENNPAWVASCLSKDSSTDYMVFDSEVEEDPHNVTQNVGVNQSNVPNDSGPANETSTSSTTLDNSDFDPANAAKTEGEIDNNLLLIPYYNDTFDAQFWDAGGDTGGSPDNTSQDFSPSALGAAATSTAFWELREGQDDNMLPQTVNQIVNNSWASGTVLFQDGNTTSPSTFDPMGYDVEDVSIDDGCIPLEGRMAHVAAENPNIDAQETSALQPDSPLYFGFDWHFPFSTGNEAQGDRLELSLGFNFSQVRHSESPEFQNVYAPGNNTPEAGN